MQVEWRRAKVLELLSKGDSQSDIAKTLQVDLSIISRDVYFLRQHAKTNIKSVSDKSKENLKSYASDSNESDREESKEPDYDQDRHLLEGKREEETDWVTTNEVF